MRNCHTYNCIIITGANQKLIFFHITNYLLLISLTVKSHLIISFITKFSQVLKITANITDID